MKRKAKKDDEYNNDNEDGDGEETFNKRVREIRESRKEITASGKKEKTEDEERKWNRMKIKIRGR